VQFVEMLIARLKSPIIQLNLRKKNFDFHLDTPYN